MSFGIKERGQHQWSTISQMITVVIMLIEHLSWRWSWHIWSLSPWQTLQGNTIVACYVLIYRRLQVVLEATTAFATCGIPCMYSQCNSLFEMVYWRYQFPFNGNSNCIVTYIRYHITRMAYEIVRFTKILKDGEWNVNLSKPLLQPIAGLLMFHHKQIANKLLAIPVHTHGRNRLAMCSLEALYFSREHGVRIITHFSWESDFTIMISFHLL